MIDSNKEIFENTSKQCNKLKKRTQYWKEDQ